MKRILVINLGGIGDLLLSMPSLKALRNLYPQAEIYMLIPAKVYEIVKNLPYINNIFIFDISYRGLVSFGKVLRNLWILFILRRKHFDLAINMRTLHSKRSAKRIKFILDIIKPKTKAGRDTERRGEFFDIRIPETDTGQKYEMEYDIDTVKALGAEIIDKTIDFKIGEESAQKVSRILEKEHVSNDTILIGIHPGGAPSRRWPFENFSKVIDEIHKKIPSCKFVITGARYEMSLVSKLTKITNVGVINFIGRLNIMELGALIKRFNLYISNDTAPMHIAAILKTPLVALFGPGDITRYNPRNISDMAVVLYKKVECAPCIKTSCQSLQCLKMISVKEVLEAALNLIRQNKTL